MGLTDYLTASTAAFGRKAADWEEAVRQAGALLEQSEAIAPKYTQAMVDMVKQLGPYIVIMPGVAFAHARPDGSVFRNGISLVTYPEGVAFGNEYNDPVYALFAIAARTDEEHLILFRDLAKFLEEEKNIERLKSAACFAEAGF